MSTAGNHIGNPDWHYCSHINTPSYNQFNSSKCSPQQTRDTQGSWSQIPRVRYYDVGGQQDNFGAFQLEERRSVHERSNWDQQQGAYQDYCTSTEHLPTVSPANPVGISDTHVVDYCDYNRSSAESIRSQPNGRMSRDRSCASKSHRSGRSHHRSSSSRSSSHEKGSARRHGSSRHSKSHRSHRSSSSSSRSRHRHSRHYSESSDSDSDSSSEQHARSGRSHRNRGRFLIFPRLQLILGIRIGTHSYISLSVWPESMSGPQLRK